MINASGDSAARVRKAVCLLLLGIAVTIPAETGMCLVTSRDGGGYYDNNSGDIRRIDLQDGVVVSTTEPLGYGCFPRFSPDGTKFAHLDGNAVRIRNVNGGLIRNFLTPIGQEVLLWGNISWTETGIWVSGDSCLMKYDTLGNPVTTYRAGVRWRNYVSHNEITGAGVDVNSWGPVIYHMRSGTWSAGTMPPGTDIAGCSACPSPDGTKLTNNLGPNSIEPGDPADGHRSMRILDTLGNMLMYLRLENATPFSDMRYRWNTQCWSSNSNDWIVIPVGEGNGWDPDENVSACIYNINTQEKICLKDNSGTNLFWQPYDYYSGMIPGSAPSLQLSPSNLSFSADSGGSNPLSQTVAASTASGTIEGVSVGGQPSWLTVTPSESSGSSIAISNTASIAGLSVGTHSATVTVSTSNAGSKDYTVALTVRRPSVQQQLTSLEVSPPVFTLPTAQSIALLATPRDQTGTLMKGVSISWWASGGGSVSSTGIFTAGNSVGGAHRIVATAASGGVTLRDTALIDVSNIWATYKRITCGDNAIAVAGWENDDQYASGGYDWTNPSTVSIAGVPAAAPSGVYRSARRGAPHTYTVPGLPYNRYTVRLHLADDSQTARNMDYSVCGVNVLRDFEIVEAAGGINRALAMDFPVDLRSGGDLTISCDGTDALEAGIEIMENRPTGITLLSPNGGETYAVGQTVPVVWYADINKVNQVYVELSVAAGRGTWLPVCSDVGIKTTDTDQWGHYQWTIPPTVATLDGPVSTLSSECLIRIKPYFLDASAGPSISQGTFTIADGAGVKPGDARARSRVGTVVSGSGGLTITMNTNGFHTVTVSAVDGRELMRSNAKGSRSYRLGREFLAAGLYVVTMESGGTIARRTVVVGR